MNHHSPLRHVKKYNDLKLETPEGSRAIGRDAGESHHEKRASPTVELKSFPGVSMYFNQPHMP